MHDLAIAPTKRPGILVAPTRRVNLKHQPDDASLTDLRRSPFNLDDNAAYDSWRRDKLAATPLALNELRVDIEDPAALHSDEISSLTHNCAISNFTLFRLEEQPADPVSALTRLGQQVDLCRLDHNLCAEDSGLTALSDHETATDKQYIPYTNKPLSWHTDGYYNAADKQVLGWLLYCEQSAAEGGDNQILDPEIAYLRLRDQDPALVRALMDSDALTIPANQEGGIEIRPAHSGPVFSLTDTGRLHMRYSARKRHVIWKDDPATLEAAAFLQDLFSSGDDHIYTHRLEPGEGILSNNALHRRTGFRDDPAHGRKRLIYRARYHDRVNGT